jgi:DNA-binding PadR family transcriptional regulator
VSKNELIEYGEIHELPFIADAETDSTQGKYRRLETNVMSELINLDYVELEEKGRKKYVRITEDGVNTLRAFRYLVE